MAKYFRKEALPHILYCILLHSEFLNIWGKIYFLFFRCSVDPWLSVMKTATRWQLKPSLSTRYQKNTVTWSQANCTADTVCIYTTHTTQIVPCEYCLLPESISKEQLSRSIPPPATALAPSLFFTKADYPCLEIATLAGCDRMTELIFFYIFKIPPISKCSEPVFVNFYGAQESIPPDYVAWRTGTTNRVVVPTRLAGIDSWTP